MRTKNGNEETAWLLTHRTACCHHYYCNSAWESFLVFANARAKARQPSCLSNMKQFGLAFTQYVQDYDEKTPVTMFLGDTRTSQWASQLYQYTKSTRFYKCPDDSTAPVATQVPVSYAVNQNVNQSDRPGVALSAQSSPAETVHLFEVSGTPANVTSLADFNSGVGNGYSTSVNLQPKATAFYTTGPMGGSPTPILTARPLAAFERLKLPARRRSC